MVDPALFKSFTPISLEEMGNVKLMNRIDTKYVTHISNIERLLKLVAEDFFIQEIEGEFNMPYFTCYYDTPETDMFYQHQRGKKTRQKVRSRLYEGSALLPFLEVKSKNNKGRTRKKRVQMDAGSELINYEDFMTKQSDYLINDLSPKIENRFYRITLVNKNLTERITIDTSLHFNNLITGKSISLDEIGIIEWKRDGNSEKSKLDSYLKSLRIKPSGFSKYCIGMALTDSSLRQNRLKEKLRRINKISESVKREL